MPNQMTSTAELEDEFSILRTETDRHQVGAVGEASPHSQFVEPNEEPTPKPQPTPEPPPEPKPSGILRHP